MTNNWEYKVLTIKRSGSFWTAGTIPKDDEITAVLNEAGQLGWELVNVVSIAPSMPLRALFKRPR